MIIEPKKNQFIIGLVVITIVQLLNLPMVFLFIGIFLVFDAIFGKEKFIEGSKDLEEM